MLFKDRDEHSAPLFNTLKLLNFNNNFNLKLSLFLWKAKNNNLPNSIQKLFNISKNINNTPQDFKLPFPRTNTKKASIFFPGIKFWNEKIPTNIKTLHKLGSFIATYKKYISNAQGFKT